MNPVWDGSHDLKDKNSGIADNIENIIKEAGGFVNLTVMH